ncbi:MAG: hypothetical protein KBC11_03170 [Candidatus Pacebacteria bacterium]|nr:hypothetical protein [Candidatus Paceibacterota bacterium]
MRRILIILIILGITAGAVWYFEFRKTSSTTEDSGGIFKSFFPLGGNGDINTDSDNQVSDITNQDNVVSSSSPFKQLTTRPIAGFTVFSKTSKITIPPIDPKGKPTVETVTNNFIRYVARQSGFVYEIKDDGNPLQISNIFIPSIYEAQFADNADTAILRFLKEDGQTIGAYSVPIPPENTDGSRTQKEGVFLPDNIKSLAISPDTKELVRLTEIQTQGVVTTSSSFDKNKKELTISPLKEWLLSWPTKDVYMQSKATGTVDGFLYKIEGDRRLRRIIGNVKGLTTSVSPSGNFILYSETLGTSFQTKIMNIKTGSIKNTNLSILPEKCTWLQNDDLICAGSSSVEQGIYPDVWYAGLISFSDQIYRIYTANNIFDVLYTGDQGSFDMTNLSVDENRNLLFFINKRTGILWQFSL